MVSLVNRGCCLCGVNKPQIRKDGLNKIVCRSCFVSRFEEEVNATIVRYNLMPRGSRVCIGVSGGKDSSALLHCLDVLNERHDYGVTLVMLAIDEGIAGYRDRSLECVEKAKKKYAHECLILSYEDLYRGWTMDRIVMQTGFKQTCSHCGCFRRHALEMGAQKLRSDFIATGHNADDSVETILMNYLRGDHNRLDRCCGVVTGGVITGLVPRIKPFYFMSQNDVVLYCHLLGLDYFSTECPYACAAFRGEVRKLVQELKLCNSGQSLRDILRTHSKPTQQTHEDTSEHQALQAVCRGCGLRVLGGDPQCAACKQVDKLCRLATTNRRTPDTAMGGGGLRPLANKTLSPRDHEPDHE